MILVNHKFRLTTLSSLFQTMLTQPPQVDWLNVLTCFASLGIFFVEILITSCQGRPWTVMPLRQRRGKTSIYLTYFAQVRRRHYHTCPVVVVFSSNLPFLWSGLVRFMGLKEKLTSYPQRRKVLEAFLRVPSERKRVRKGENDELLRNIGKYGSEHFATKRKVALRNTHTPSFVRANCPPKRRVLCRRVFTVTAD